MMDTDNIVWYDVYSGVSLTLSRLNLSSDSLLNGGNRGMDWYRRVLGLSDTRWHKLWIMNTCDGIDNLCGHVTTPDSIVTVLGEDEFMITDGRLTYHYKKMKIAL